VHDATLSQKVQPWWAKLLGKGNAWKPKKLTKKARLGWGQKRKENRIPGGCPQITKKKKGVVVGVNAV